MAQDISGSTPVIDPDLLHAAVIPIRTAHGDLVSKAAYKSHLYVFPNLTYMTTIIPRRSGNQEEGAPSSCLRALSDPSREEGKSWGSPRCSGSVLVRNAVLMLHALVKTTQVLY